MVNVIIPTYKARDTLPRALDSLVAQTKKMFLVTIVQDCDDEDYSDIVEEYTRRGLNCTLLKTPVNGGPGFARQYGMDHDKMCDYFMFLDSDDMFNPRAIEILYHEAKSADLDILASNFIAVRKYSNDLMLDANSIPCTWTHGKIYKAKYLRDNNIRFLDDLRLNEDAYFNLVAHNCTQKKKNLQEYMYLWMDNKESLTRAKEDGEKDAFFKKSWLMYIESQVMGLLKIDEILGKVDPELTAMTCINIYNHCMRAIFNKFSLDETIPLLNKLKENDSIQKNLDTEKFWLGITNNLKASLLTDEKDLFFFRQRFPDWLNKYIVREVKNEHIYH